MTLPPFDELEQEFLSCLPRDGTPIGNITLQRMLGWKDRQYDSIHDRLRQKGVIVAGKGRGGSVRLVEGDKQAVLAFIPEDGSQVTHQRILKELGWRPEHYNRIVSGLIDDDIVGMTTGKRGKIWRLSTPEMDEQALLKHLPQGIHGVFNAASVAARLGWSEQYVWQVRAQCITKEHQARTTPPPKSKRFMAAAVGAADTEDFNSSAASSVKSSVRIFVACAPADDGLRVKLNTHLSSLRRSGSIKDFSSQEIQPGTDRSKAIRDGLDRADVVLLLVSADFLSSSHCYDIEMSRAMERHAIGEAIVIPVILRPCDWSSEPFAKLRALPTDGRPLTRWDDQDEAFVNVVDGIRRILGR